MTRTELVTLHSEEWSLILEHREDAPPLWRYLGARLAVDDLPPLSVFRESTTFSLDVDQPMDVFPARGCGWFGIPSLSARRMDGRELPILFGEAEVQASDTALSVHLSDAVSDVGTKIVYARTPGGGLSITSVITNLGSEPMTLERIASCIVPLPSQLRTIISSRGRHNAELQECREPMPEHSWMREGRQGLTGHGGPAGFQILSEAAGWHSGLVYSLQQAWSGDSRLTIDRNDEGAWYAVAEAVLAPGECILAAGETYAAPAVLLGISTRGRNGAARQQRGAVQSLVTWPSGAMRPRPVHLNSWEACYFVHDEARIEKLVEGAAAIGVERFVMDDGWFKGRNNDRVGLGDWTPDPAKYPDGLARLGRRIEAAGMEFGLWVEPEMVNPDSDLYRAHPDWVLALPGRGRPTARNQLLLDMRRAEVREYLFNCLDTLLSAAPISYLKWDHNRAHAPGGGAAQVHGIYELLQRLRHAHPEIEIESCAAGGGRIDAGVARFAHRFWTSDNIDAVSRIPIQRGYLAFMPPEMMGAHVGAVPNHVTGRRQSLDFRAAIACQGHLGVELDPVALPDDSREALANWIEFYKKWRPIIHGGQVFMGEGSDGLLWQAQGNGSEMLLWLIRLGYASDRQGQPVRLPFAELQDWDIGILRLAGCTDSFAPRMAQGFVNMLTKPMRISGSWLAHAGLPAPLLPAEGAAIFHLKAI